MILRTPLTVALIAFSQFISCGFAVAETTASLSSLPKFNANRAFDDLVKQCDFGPRLPQTDAHQKTREYIQSTLAEHGFSNATQQFEANSPLLGKTVPGVNLYGIYPKASKVKYLLSAHYDTRPFADQDKNPENRSKPITGANDGASGVAVLLELARNIPLLKLPHGIALVFYDLEDHGAPSESEGFCLGSQFLAAHLPAELNFEAGINLDMVGDSDLRLPLEMYSLKEAPDLVIRLWDLGAQLHPTVFVKENGMAVYDDNIVFLRQHKRYIDIIDFQYPSWHTVADTVDKCSPESLGIVGDTLLRFVQN